MAEDSVKNLILAAKAGDREAFGLVYEKYLTPIYRFIYFRAPNKIEAEDLTQEVFLRAFEHLSNFEWRGENFLPYLFSIARNLLTDTYRKKKSISLEELEETEIPENSIDLIENYAETEIFEKVKEILAGFKAKEREVLTLKLMADYKNKEIAELLGRSEMVVRQASSRGLRTLRKILIEKGIYGKRF